MADAPPQPEPARLCLNMIVRNEMANLPRCLDAIAPHIACWVIGDTGSSDGTQDFIRAYFAARSIPGELHAFPFVNFEQARNAALDHAYASPLPYDYLLLADADMELVVDDPAFRARLDAPGYQLLQRAGESRLLYWNTRLVRRDTPARARYHGVTHEYLDVAGDPQKLPGVWFKDHVSGANRTHKIERDINLLQAALQADPADRRTWYYLAQSYRDAGRMRDAADTYAKRAAMGGWEEEAWNARLHEARCLRALGDDAGFLRAAEAAFDQRPWRAEPLYELAHHHRERGNHAAAVQYAERGLAIPRPDQDILFVEDYVYSAGLLEELAIAAFYTNDPDHKARGHAACEQLALSRTVQTETRDLARANLYFYAEPLRAIAPSFSARRIAFDPPEGWRALNPSIARHGDHIVAIQRTVNYVLREDGHYVTADGAPIATRNYLLRLSDALEVESAAEILPPADWPPPRYDQVRGFEDARLFAWRDALWCTATVRDQTPEGWCEQVLARIDDPASTTCRLTDWRMLRPDGERRHEKNWMPLVDGDALRFIYLCDPTRLVDDTARTLTETTPPIAADAFKGSSQAIAFDGGRLTLIHEVTQHDTSRAYQHRFVWFDATATLRKISRRFYLQQQGVEFVAGLAWHPDGMRLLLSYGIADSETWIATVKASEIHAVLRDANAPLISAKATMAPTELPAVKTIGLCMIVKNEAPVIVRCLESMRPLVDYVLVEDTGSTDGTQQIIRDWLARVGMPGEVFDKPWRDFAHNRSIALKRLRENKTIDYAFVMDADDVLELADGFDPVAFKRGLTEDMYNVRIQSPNVQYFRVHMCSNRQNFLYRGVLHEFLEGPAGNVASATADGLLIRYREDGARNQDPDKYRKDAVVLEKALKTEKDAFMRARYTFYLGQTYRMCNEPDRSMSAYLARAKMGFWDQEVFISLYYAAQIMENEKRPVDEVVATYLRAFDAVPTRAEALHGASRLCRNSGRYQEGYEIARRGIDLMAPDNAQYVEQWIYDYGLLDEFAVNAYWAGHYNECLVASERLLRDGEIPSGEHERIARNAHFAREKMAEEETKTNKGKKPAGSPPVRQPAQPASSTDRATTATSTPAEPIRYMSSKLHLLGVAHTIPHEDYLACAFTAKVMLFPEVIQPFGWHVVEYSNEGSVSQAHEHVAILTKDRLRALSKRASREEPLDADVHNKELQQEFQRILMEKIQSRAKPGDIVCHVWGPNTDVYNLLPDCRHIELCVGYTASPGLPFRVFESSSWMHWHYGKAGQEDGNHYKWVIPSPIDAERWVLCEEPDEYALFLGRVTPRKGMNELVEIARRMPELPIHVYGPGDPSQWAKQAPPNLLFKGPVFGDARFDVVRRARCMLMPTVFIEPFGNSGVEAQLCGVPLIATSYGAFQETIVEGVTGYRCHTLADWVVAIRLSQSLDRRQIAALARSRYSKEVVGKQYDWALRQLADLSGRGWYGEQSRKFASAAVPAQADKPPQRRIWLYIPYFGPFPNYFQLYLDSLGPNADCLSVFLLTDNDLSRYRVPDNLITIPTTLGALKESVAQFLHDEFGMEVQPDVLLKQPYKICDFRVIYPELFRDISDRYGVTEDDFVGWGDCDLIYGRLSDFLDMEEDYQVIGGFHGHLTALRNIHVFRQLFKAVPNLPELLVDEKSHLIDEVAFRGPLLTLLEQNQYRMFYSNRYFCDIVPTCFFGLFRQDHAQRKKNFFDAYNPGKDINYVSYDKDGRLTVLYDDGDSRSSIYCHLQKRAMTAEFDQHEDGYYIGEDAFHLAPPCVDDHGVCSGASDAEQDCGVPQVIDSSSQTPCAGNIVGEGEMAIDAALTTDGTTTNMTYHDQEHKFEKNYWGDCTNTFMEEQKHYIQARMMGLEVKGYGIDVGGKRILDIGGGPVSMLLKTTNLAAGMVCDPIEYPAWTSARYRAKGITFLRISGEDVDTTDWDEVWIYNVLQHCMDPEKILRNARKAAPVLRLFEWIDFPPHPGHPQMLTEANLTRWLGAPGNVVQLSESGCFGKSFSGVFKQA